VTTETIFGFIPVDVLFLPTILRDSLLQPSSQPWTNAHKRNNAVFLMSPNAALSAPVKTISTFNSRRVLDMMNASNTISHAVPERIDLRFGSRPAADARIEGALVEQQHLAGGPKKPSTSKAGQELTAASALTSLVKPPSAHAHAPVDDTEEEDFDIPQRFTKSGRKKATPFPMKVCIFISLLRGSLSRFLTPVDCIIVAEGALSARV
jgi:hypothetical protein